MVLYYVVEVKIRRGLSEEAKISSFYNLKKCNAKDREDWEQREGLERKRDEIENIRNTH